jgi:hypothetical protein
MSRVPRALSANRRCFNGIFFNSALRSSSAIFSSRKGECWTCGSADHFSPDCPKNESDATPKNRRRGGRGNNAHASPTVSNDFPPLSTHVSTQVASPRSTFSHQPYASGAGLPRPPGPASQSYKSVPSSVPFQTATNDVANVPYQLTWYDQQSIINLHNSINNSTTRLLMPHDSLPQASGSRQISLLSAQSETRRIMGNASKFSDALQPRSAMVSLPRR